MGVRFRKRIRILPGVYVNIGKTGASVSAGVKGARVTAGKNGTRTSVGIPGSGLSWSTYRKGGKRSEANQQGSGFNIVMVILCLCGLVLWFLIRK